MLRILVALISALLISTSSAFASELADNIKQDYDSYLANLWDHFHQNPELSLVEFRTAERMASALRNISR